MHGREGGGRGRKVYLCILYSVTCLKTCHFTACFTSLWTSISVFYVNTARDVVTVLLIFAKYFSLYLHIFTCTYRGTRTQAHVYNQHTRGIATPGTGAWVRGAEERLCLRPSQTKKKVRKNRYSRI